jgi:hypothetical protein
MADSRGADSGGAAGVLCCPNHLLVVDTKQSAVQEY